MNKQLEGTLLLQKIKMYLLSVFLESGDFM